MSDAKRGIALPLHRRVKQEIALLGWTNTELHARSGVSRSTVEKWATQQQPPQPRTVNAVADALGIPRAEALRLAGILTDAPLAGTALPDPLERIASDRALSPEMRRAFIELAERMRAGGEPGAAASG